MASFDWILAVGIVGVVALLAWANGSQLIALVRSWWPVRPDDPIVDPDSETSADERLRTHLLWLGAISDHCEVESDEKGVALAAAVAMHLTQRRFGSGGEE